MKKIFGLLFLVLVGIKAQAQLIISNTITTDVFCSGMCNGTIQIFATNGTAPYQYAINGGAFQSSNLFSGLCQGVYTVTVQDALSNSTTSSSVITQPPPITIISTIHPSVNCSGDSLCLFVIGGAGAVTTNIFPGNIFLPSSGCVGGLAQGAYTIVASDMNGCSTFGSALITNSNTPPFSLSTIKLDSTCYGGLNSAKVIPSLPGTYIYNWNSSPPQTTDSAYNLAAGSYTVTVTNSNSCSLTEVVSFNAINNTWNAIADSASYCLNENALIHISSNTTINAANIQVFPNTNISVINANTLYANPTITTTYTLVNNAPDICNDTNYVTIVKSIPSTMQVTMIATNASCPLSADGSVTAVVTPSSVTPSFYWWNNNTTNTISNLMPNMYTCEVNDNNGGCIWANTAVTSLNTNCGNLVGTANYDMNLNCIKDNNELGVNNILITANPGNHTMLTNASGQFQFLGLPYGTYTVTQTSNNTNFLPFCTSTFTYTLSIANPIDTLVYQDSVTALADFYCYAYGAWCIAPLMPWTHIKGISYGHNIPGQTFSGTVYAVMDSFNHFASSIPAPTSFSGDTIFWNFSNIVSWSTIQINWAINPNLPMGLVMPFKCGIINTNVVDNILLNNHSAINHQICTSFDPNDKQVSPSGKLANGYIKAADSLPIYTIRFQNTGTAPAVNITVLDTLSSLLETNSIEVLHASHNYFLEILNGNILKFRFPNIMLPDSGTDYDASQGAITFSIKHQPNLVAGNIINNASAIYFDNNAPVITNTVTNTIYTDVSNNPTASFRNTSCNLPCGNGSLVMNSVGGVSPYSYSIAPSCSSTIINGNQINNLVGGTYTITTLDAIGNTTSSTAIIDNPVPINMNLNVVQPIGTLGSATVNPTGGTPPYDYLWTPSGATTNAITGLVAGTYTISILDANGCSTSSAIELNYATNIGDELVQQSIKLYPNPVSKMLNVESSEAVNDFAIMNNLGQVVLQKNIFKQKEFSIDVSSLANGIYSLKLGEQVIRFVVER